MQTIEWGIIITLGRLGAVSVCVYSWQCSVIGRQPLSTLYCTTTGLLVGGWESKTQESEHRTARESDGTQHTQGRVWDTVIEHMMTSAHTYSSQIMTRYTFHNKSEHSNNRFYIHQYMCRREGESSVADRHTVVGGFLDWAVAIVRNM